VAAAATVTDDRSRPAHRPPFCRGEACLAQPRRRVRHTDARFAGPQGRMGRARPAPTRVEPWFTSQGWTCAAHRQRSATRHPSCRGEACPACRAPGEAHGVGCRPAGPDGSGVPDPYRDNGGQRGTGGPSARDRGPSAMRRPPRRGDACVARPRRRRGNRPPTSSREIEHPSPPPLTRHPLSRAVWERGSGVRGSIACCGPSTPEGVGTSRSSGPDCPVGSRTRDPYTDDAGRLGSGGRSAGDRC